MLFCDTLSAHNDLLDDSAMMDSQDFFSLTSRLLCGSEALGDQLSAYQDSFLPPVLHGQQQADNPYDIPLLEFAEASPAPPPPPRSSSATVTAPPVFPEPAARLSEQVASETALSPPLPSTTRLSKTASPTLRKRARFSAKVSSESEDEVSSPSTGNALPQQQRSRTSSSAFRGVSRCTKDGRWQARIRIQKEVVYLGRFPTEELAARRYDEAARLNHGRQAVLNFITHEDVLGGCKSVFSASPIL